MRTFQIIIGIPLALLRLFFLALYTIFLFIICIIINNFGGKNKSKHLWWLMKIWNIYNLRILGVRIKYFEKNPIIRSGLILPNHRSYIDIFVNISIAPVRIIAKKEIASWPIMGRGFKIYDTLLIDRSSMASRMQNLRKIEEVVKKGSSIILYPEGTTHRGPGIGNLKQATFSIAAKNNFPIQLIALEYKNPDDAWVGNDLFVPHFIRRSGVLSRKVGVSISEPIYGSDEKQLIEKAQKWLTDETLKMRAYFDGETKRACP